MLENLWHFQYPRSLRGKEVTSPPQHIWFSGILTGRGLDHFWSGYLQEYLRLEAEISMWVSSDGRALWMVVVTAYEERKGEKDRCLCHRVLLPPYFGAPVSTIHLPG